MLVIVPSPGLFFVHPINNSGGGREDSGRNERSVNPVTTRRGTVLRFVVKMAVSKIVKCFKNLKNGFNL